MAQGNIFLLIPEADKGKPVPAKLKDKWQFTEPVLDPVTGEPTGETVVVHPSWLGAANRLRKNFGAVIPLNYNSNQVQLIELELSYIEGEVAEVEKLQSNQPTEKHKYAILTNTEAQKFIRFCEGDETAEDIFLKR